MFFEIIFSMQQRLRHQELCEKWKFLGAAKRSFRRPWIERLKLVTVHFFAFLSFSLLNYVGYWSLSCWTRLIPYSLKSAAFSSLLILRCSESGFDLFKVFVMVHYKWEVNNCQILIEHPTPSTWLVISGQLKRACFLAAPSLGNGASAMSGRLVAAVKILRRIFFFLFRLYKKLVYIIFLLSVWRDLKKMSTYQI